ncbi:TPA: hypothetical protein ACMDUI_004708, partial [Vibrio parahaemolyticus]
KEFSMTFSELFSCRESVESRVNQYWTFWSVAVFAVCGWLFSGEQPKFSPEEAWLIVLGLAVFFAANLSVIYSATKVSILLHDEMCRQATSEDLSDSFKSRFRDGKVKFRLEFTVVMHVIVDVALFAIILIQGVK